MTRIVFGTDGWRARIAEEYTFDAVRICSQAVAEWVRREGAAERGVVVGYDRRFAGQTDSPLTEIGRRQAEIVADALRDIPFDRVVSSDLSRARDTAEVIARRHGLALEVFPELREIDVGEAAGRQFEDLRQRPDWTPEGFVQWPGGESLQAALERMTTIVDRLVAESPGKRICVVGHGGTTRILVSHFLGLLPKLYRHPTPSANTNITVVHTDGITYRVEALFEAGHLAERPPSPEERSADPDAAEGGGAI